MSDEYSPWFSRLALFGLRAFTPQVPAQCYNPPRVESAGQSLPACRERKVRAPQGRMPVNDRALQGDGKWNREQNRRWPGNRHRQG